MFPFGKTTAAAKRTSWPNGDNALLEQAPGLKDGVERVLASVVKSLQTMAGTATKIEGMTKGFAPASMRDILAANRPDMVTAVIECAAVPCSILLTLDEPLVHAIVELLCGGNGMEPLPDEAREVTSIDQQFAHILVTLTTAAMQKEWADRGFKTARSNKIDGAPPPDILGTRQQDVGLVSVAIVAFGLEGTMNLVLPQQALQRFSDAGGSAVVADASSDPEWTARFEKELGRAPVKVDVYLDANDLTLGSIAHLQIGQILTLPDESRHHATLVCDGRAFYRGEIGQEDDHYSLRIGDIIPDAPLVPHLGTRPGRSIPPFDMPRT